MPDITTAESGASKPEQPLMIDNQTYEILMRAQQDTEMVRLDTYHTRAMDLSFAFEGTGASVEVDDEAVHPTYIGSEMAALLARRRTEQQRQLLRNEAGRSIMVPLMQSTELRGTLALNTRAHLARLALSA